jgi:molybdate transport system regulatory protein
MNDVRLTVRIDFGSERALGPGKIRLLEAVGRTGSISQAGRALDMSYRRAGLLIDDMNQCFREPVVTTQSGGAQGGGAELTPRAKLIATYRAIESPGARGGEAAAARARARCASVRARRNGR